MPDQVITTSMAYGLEADAYRARAQFAWIIMRDQPDYPDKFVARFATEHPIVYVLTADISVRCLSINHGARFAPVMWKFLNSSLFIWFLGTVVLGFVGVVYTSQNECMTKTESMIRSYQRAEIEFKSRLDQMMSDILVYKTKRELLTRLSDTYHFLEYKDKPFGEIATILSEIEDNIEDSDHLAQKVLAIFRTFSSEGSGVASPLEIMTLAKALHEVFLSIIRRIVISLPSGPRPTLLANCRLDQSMMRILGYKLPMLRYAPL